VWTDRQQSFKRELALLEDKTSKNKKTNSEVWELVFLIRIL